MAKISDFSEELLLKIISFLETRNAVSTSVLSKQWKFLWMWCPHLRFDCNGDSARDFINKNLPLHKAPVIKSLSLGFEDGQYQADDSKTWVGIAVSRGLIDLHISSCSDSDGNNEVYAVFLLLPSSLYTCSSLVTLDLHGGAVLVDVPPNVCLPSMKSMKLTWVKYSNDDSLRLLLCCCPVLEDLLIDRDEYDNLGELVVKVPSLQRFSLIVYSDCLEGASVIVTPSLKYFELRDERWNSSYSIEHMPDLVKANIDEIDVSCLEVLLKAISSVKSLSLRVTTYSRMESDNIQQTVYGDGFVFNMLEDFDLYVCSDNWSNLAYQLLKDSPNLQHFYVFSGGSEAPLYPACKPDWRDNESLVPDCLLNSLKSFIIEDCLEELEEGKDFVSFINKYTCCLESPTMSP